METIEYLNKAIDYIEEHITETMDVEEIAKSALLSKFYFQRIFHVITGFTVAEYIRNRKLTLAAEELAATEKTVTEIALFYGYESSDAFTKAFKRLHGLTPSAIRQGKVQIKSFPKISLKVNVTGNTEIKYRIVEKKAFDMIGLAMEMTSKAKSDIEVTRFCNRVWDD